MPDLVETPIDRIVNDAYSEMRSPTNFNGLASALAEGFEDLSDEQRRELGVRSRAQGREQEVEERRQLAAGLAETGNLLLVFEGEDRSDLDFVLGDERNRRLIGAFLITDSVPAELPITEDGIAYVLRQGQQVQGGWELSEFDGLIEKAARTLFQTEELRARADRLEAELEEARSEIDTLRSGEEEGSGPEESDTEEG